jgi:hypothetical protein
MPTRIPPGTAWSVGLEFRTPVSPGCIGPAFSISTDGFREPFGKLAR